MARRRFQGLGLLLVPLILTGCFTAAEEHPPAPEDPAPAPAPTPPGNGAAPAPDAGNASGAPEAAPPLTFHGCRSSYTRSGVPEEKARALLPAGLEPVKDAVTGLAAYGFYAVACEDARLGPRAFGPTTEWWEIVSVVPAAGLSGGEVGHWYVASVATSQPELDAIYASWGMAKPGPGTLSRTDTTLPNGGMLSKTTLKRAEFTAELEHAFSDPPTTRSDFRYRFFGAKDGAVTDVVDAAWTPHSAVGSQTGGFQVTAGKNAPDHPGGAGNAYAFAWEPGVLSVSVTRTKIGADA